MAELALGELRLTIVAPAGPKPTGSFANGESPTETAWNQFIKVPNGQFLSLQGPPPPPSPPLRISAQVAGQQLDLEVNPFAVPDLVLGGYSIGGWATAHRLASAVVQSVTGLERLETQPERLPSPTGAEMTASDEPGPWLRFGSATQRVDPSGNLAIRLVAETLDQLNELVIGELLEISDLALAHASLKIADLGERLQAEQERYGIRVKPDPTTPSTGTEGGSPDYQPVFEAHDPTEVGAAASLVKVVQRLVALQNIVQRLAAQVGPSGAEGGSGSDIERTDRSADEERVAQAQRNFDAELQRILPSAAEMNKPRPPGKHAIAPAVLVLVCQDQTPGHVSASEQDILRTAFEYVLDAQARLTTALPTSYPRPGLNGAMRTDDRVSRLGRFEGDSPHARAALWARRDLGNYRYEPMDDEALLMELLAMRRERLSRANNDQANFEDLFQYQVLADLIMSRDVADAVEAVEEKDKVAPYASAGRAAGVLDIIGLLIPPVGLAGLALSGYVLYGSACLAIEALGRANRKIDQRIVASLLSSDSARYATLLAARPSLFGFVADFVLQIAALHAIGKISRGAAVLLQIYMDLSVIFGDDEVEDPRTGGNR